MAEEIRQYPRLENLEAMENCCPAIVKARGDCPINLLGVEQLLKMMCHEDIRSYYKIEEDTVYAHARDVLETGDASWIVRWATDRDLGFKQSGELSYQDWATFGLRSLKKVIKTLEEISTLGRNRLQQDRKLEDQEEDRLLRLLDLLEQCFMLTHNSLIAAESSNVGVQELINVANEGDILSLGPGKNLRQRFSTLKATEPKHKCFKYIAKAVVKRLSKWEHPIRVEIALRTMLPVIPKLEPSVLERLSIGVWGSALARQGLGDAGRSLTIAVNEQLSLLLEESPEAVAGLLFDGPPSPLLQPSEVFYQVPDRTPLQTADAVNSGAEISDEGTESENHTSRDNEPQWTAHLGLCLPGTRIVNGARPVHQPSFDELFRPGQLEDPHETPVREMFKKASISSQDDTPTSAYRKLTYEKAELDYFTTPTPSIHSRSSSAQSSPTAKRSRYGAEKTAGRDHKRVKLDGASTVSLDFQLSLFKVTGDPKPKSGHDRLPTIVEEDDGAVDHLTTIMDENDAGAEDADADGGLSVDQSNCKSQEEHPSVAESADTDVELSDDPLDSKSADEHQPPSTKWQEYYETYKGWNRSWKVGRIWLFYMNDERKQVLKDMARAERQGDLLYEPEIDDEERKLKYENMEADIKSIEAGLEAARSYRPNCGNGYRKLRKLGKVIDWQEDDILEYHDVDTGRIYTEQTIYSDCDCGVCDEAPCDCDECNEAGGNSGDDASDDEEVASGSVKDEGGEDVEERSGEVSFAEHKEVEEGEEGDASDQAEEDIDQGACERSEQGKGGESDDDLDGEANDEMSDEAAEAAMN